MKDTLGLLENAPVVSELNKKKLETEIVKRISGYIRQAVSKGYQGEGGLYIEEIQVNVRKAIRNDKKLFLFMLEKATEELAIDFAKQNGLLETIR